MPSVWLVNLEGSHILFQQIRKVHLVVMMPALDGNHRESVPMSWLQLNGLNSFVASYRKAKVQSNYTAVVTHNLPKGIGSKPGKQQK